MALLTHPVSTYYCRDYLSAGKLASVVGNARKPSPSGYVYVYEHMQFFIFQKQVCVCVCLCVCMHACMYVCRNTVMFVSICI